MALARVQAQEAQIEVHAERVLHPVSRYLTGACIEDVNHEQYGGIDSQMIFGESFAEPAPLPPLKGFETFGGKWTVEPEGGIKVLGSDGAKIVWDGAAFNEGEVSVDVWLSESGAGNAGLILKVSDAAKGADMFNGYEVSLERPGTLVLGRHRHNWEPLQRVACDVPVEQWTTLQVRLTAKTLEVLVNGKSVTKYEDTAHPLESGRVGLRTWQHDVRFRNLTVTTGGQRQQIPFAASAKDAWGGGVSGMWRALRGGTAKGGFRIEEQNPFSGKQSQQIEFSDGQGEIGIENQGLNRWGMNFVRGKVYEGFLYVRAPTHSDFFVALESRDGAKSYAEKCLKAVGGDWQRLNFRLTPKASDSAGRFAIKLKQPGSMTVGYALLQPGGWGRFKGLPVRKDVAEGLSEQGITVLRQGGCMANATEYRWKKMIGPRERRPPYTGWWYPYASNGWGIFDFLNFCEAAGFVGIPDVNMGETPQDMADFMEYVNGPANSEWGRRRVADGHPKPYGLKYIELGNEERVNDDYASKFEALAKAIWAKDPKIILVVGDFAYTQTIQDPFNFHGAASRITSLSAQQRILKLAKEHGREVWFDVHVGTDGPRPDAALAGMFSFRDALDRIADGARHSVVVFEFNAGNHSQRRALANALAIQAVAQDGRIPVATSANCLQPDHQNDNDWDQGLLFLNPSKVWLQPPGYVTRMFSRDYLPQLVECDVTAPRNTLDVIATSSADGDTLALNAVNPTDKPIQTGIRFTGFVPRKRMAKVTELSGPLSSRNTAEQPNAVVAQQRSWEHDFKEGGAVYTFPPYSVNVLRFE